MERKLVSADNLCPKVNMCQSQSGDGVATECPKIRNQREAERYFGSTKTVLDERLCIEALMRHPQVSSNKDPYKQTYNDAVFNLEVSFSHYDASERRRHFDDFLSLQTELEQVDISEILNQNKLDYYLKGQVFSIFIPAFEARLDNKRPNQQQKNAVHSNLCQWIDNVDQQIIEPIRNSGASKSQQEIKKKLVGSYRTELEVAGLITRKGEDFPWPALPREESGGIKSEYNHDYYIIDQDGNKKPWQTKTNKCSGKYKLPVVTHQAILQGAKRATEIVSQSWTETGETWPPKRHDFEQRLVPPLVPTIKDLLLEEFKYGQNMNSAHLSLLNLASMYVISIIYDQHGHDSKSAKH